MTEGEGEGVRLAPLTLRSGISDRTFIGPSMLAFVGISALFAYGLGDGWNVWDMGFFGFMGLLGLATTIYGLAPLTLIADETGVHYRAWGYRRSYPWSEIESVGVGRNRNFDGWDAPAARAIMGPAPKIPPTIGLNLKVGTRDAGKAAYRRGFNGYEVSFPDAFDKGPRWIVTALQERLEQARRDAAEAAAQEVGPGA
ncbi:MAG: hypothetical protein EBR82_02060 [Caulobacteraceae bacterium]|nr:hypothetical protein [Caulobacteraceae bacterium]